MSAFWSMAGSVETAHFSGRVIALNAVSPSIFARPHVIWSTPAGRSGRGGAIPIEAFWPQ